MVVTRVMLLLLTVVSCMKSVRLGVITKAQVNETLKTIAIDSYTGDVFAGGANTIYRFTSDLRFIQSVSLTPSITDSVCHGVERDVCCDGCRKSRIYVLEADSHNRRLFVCSSAVKGLCSVHHLANITDRYWLDPRQNSNFIGRASIVAFVDSKNHSSSFPRRTTAIVCSSWLAHNLDDNLEAQTAELSFRTIDTENDSPSMMFNGDVYIFVEHYNRTLGLHDTITPVEFVAALIVQSFTLLVTVQSTNKTPVATKLVRVYNNRAKDVRDTSLFPLTELELACEHNDVEYNIATTASVGTFYDSFKKSLKLLVSFGKSLDQGSLLANPNLGSVLCAFKMDDIISEMDYIAGRCSTTEACSSPKWVSVPSDCREAKRPGGGASCREKCAVCRNTDAAGGVDHDVVYHQNDVVFVGVVVDTDEHTYSSTVFLGTDAGQLIKVTDRKPDGTEVLNVTENMSIPLQRDLEGSGNNSHVYMIGGTTIFKVNLDFCARKLTCEECVSALCIWCVNKCVRKRACEVGMENTCPPVLTEISPVSGVAGTLLTLRGRRFGNGTYSGGNVTVTVCGESCKLQSITTTRILCWVQGAVVGDGPRGCDVTVFVRELSRRIKIDGFATSGHNFTFKEATVISCYPVLGPRSGGTNVTIHGRNLDVGSDPCVYIGNLTRCFVTSIAKDEINCTTERLVLVHNDIDVDTNVSTATLPACGEIFIVINNATLKSESSVRFCYYNDPDISSITPRRTIESGGLLITVKGRHLNTVLRPRIGITVNGSSDSPLLGNCEVDKGGDAMTCQSPEPGRVLDGTDSVFGNIWFEMDGVEKMRNFSQYYPSLSTFSVYPDPELLPFNGSDVPTVKPNTRLEIQGSGMKDVISERDISILIGDKTCRQIVVHRTRVVCTPHARAQTESLHVTVKIGHVQFNIGLVRLSGVGGKTPPQRLGSTLPISTDLLIGLSVGGAAFVTIVTVVLVIAFIKIRSHKEHRPLSEYSSSDGYQLSAMQRALDTPTLEKINSCNILVQRHLLTIGEIIGSGNFGCVHEGYLKGDNLDSIPKKVAVKTLLESSGQLVDFKAFVEEALLMKDFDHPNVLCLVGITLTRDRLPLVVLPYMENGDLLKYVSNETQVLTVKEVVRFGVDIAAGMRYLANLKFVHRDLAARNCMLDESFQVKVADFGLCRDIYEKGYYCSDNKKKLPIRWMAIESIDKGTYSSKSDVWSLGVVLWELLTRGVTPYPGVDGWDIIRFLQLGKRLFRPWFCSEDMYTLMLRCWSRDPSDRPTFHMVSEQLERMLKDVATTSAPETEVTGSECCQYRGTASCSGYLELEDAVDHAYPPVDTGRGVDTSSLAHGADCHELGGRTLNDPMNPDYHELSDRDLDAALGNPYHGLSNREGDGSLRHSYYTLDSQTAANQQRVVPEIKTVQYQNFVHGSEPSYSHEPMALTEVKSRDGSRGNPVDLIVKSSASDFTQAERCDKSVGNAKEFDTKI